MGLFNLSHWTNNEYFATLYSLFLVVFLDQRLETLLKSKQTSEECSAFGPLIFSFVFGNCGRFFWVRRVSSLAACGSRTLSSPAGALTASLGLRRRSLVLVMHAVEVKCDSRVGREGGKGGGGGMGGCWAHPSPRTTCLFELTADFIGVSPVAAMEPGERRE